MDHDLAILCRHDDVIVISVEQLSSFIVINVGTSTVALVADIPNVSTEIAAIW